MIKNNRRCGLSMALAGAALFTAQAVSAAPLYLSDGDRIKLEWGAGTYGHAFGGGEFKASGVSVLNGAGDSFLTFCLEYSEHISLNTPYYVDINTAAKSGGGGAILDPSGGTYDPLNASTAWLYTQFRNNALSGFNYTSNASASNASANSLQLAIWKLEGELSGSALATYGGDSVAQGWVAAAEGSGWTTLGNVRVLNLYGSYNSSTGKFSEFKQDQLYLMPIPEPETYAMLLAGLGLMGFVARRRRGEGAAWSEVG